MINKTGFVLGGIFLVAICLAQKTDSFDFQVSDYRLLSNKKVQAEVGITEAQRAKMNKIADDERAKAIPYLKKLEKQGKDQNALGHDQTYLAFLKELHVEILRQLSPGQLKRLRELSLQSVDIAGCMDLLVSQKVGMSADQLKKMRKIYLEGVKQSTDIVKALDRQIMLKYKATVVTTQAQADSLKARVASEREAAITKKEPELKKLESQTKQRVIAVLTSKQLAAYRALQGKPFTAK